MTDSSSEAETHETADGVEYTPHSMMHKAIVRMDPTKLEMLDGFERTDAGHKFVPENSNIRVIVSGRNWDEKRILIYGSTSTEEAERYVEMIVNRVTEVGHDAKLVEGPEITNIAVSGEFDTTLQLEALNVELSEQGVDVEYEPEQFPALILKLSDPQATFLLFSTGAFSIQGLSDTQNIEPVIHTVRKIVGI